MIMNENLKSLASRLRGSVKVNLETPQEYYDFIRTKYFLSNKDYFNSFSPDELIKLVIYFYSLKTTGSFDLAEKAFENLYFIKGIWSNGYESVQECEECEGNAYQRCDVCDNTGNIDCSECYGEGSLTCSECDGDGKIGDEICDICNGQGIVDCAECDGGGRTTCDECGGSGDITCDACDGAGDIKLEGYYDIYHLTIFSWNNIINQKAELVAGQPLPLISKDKLLEQNNVIISQDYEETQEPLISDIEDGQIYVLSFDDSPELVVDRKMFIKQRNDRRLMEPFIV